MSMKLSRRSFLKCSAVATLAIAVSTTLSGCSSLLGLYKFFGAANQTLILSDGQSIDIMLIDYQTDKSTMEATPRFKIVNNTTSAVTISNNFTVGQYTLQPTLSWYNNGSNVITFDDTSFELYGQTIKAGETAEGNLRFSMNDVSIWKSADLSFSLRKGMDMSGQPVAFRFIRQLFF